MDRKIKNKLTLSITLINRFVKSIFFINNGCCRYTPSCSEYAAQALLELPIYKAPIKIIWRIIRCNPFSKGGYDPVIKEKRKVEK